MKYTLYKFDNLVKGNIVEITLRGNAANVLLLDSSNHNNYKSGRRYKYYGRYVTKSPYKIIVPYSGRWYVVINLGGYKGQVHSSVRVLSGIMPPAKTYNSSELSSLFLGNIDIDKNIFISFNFASLNAINENIDEFIEIEKVINKENLLENKVV